MGGVAKLVTGLALIAIGVFGLAHNIRMFSFGYDAYVATPPTFHTVAFMHYSLSIIGLYLSKCALESGVNLIKEGL